VQHGDSCEEPTCREKGLESARSAYEGIYEYAIRTQETDERGHTNARSFGSCVLRPNYHSYSVVFEWFQASTANMFAVWG